MPVAGDTHELAVECLASRRQDSGTEDRMASTGSSISATETTSRSSDRPAFCFAFSIQDGFVTGNVISESADAR